MELEQKQKRIMGRQMEQMAIHKIKSLKAPNAWHPKPELLPPGSRENKFPLLQISCVTLGSDVPACLWSLRQICEAAGNASSKTGKSKSSRPGSDCHEIFKVAYLENLKELA